MTRRIPPGSSSIRLSNRGGRPGREANDREHYNLLVRAAFACSAILCAIAAVLGGGVQASSIAAPLLTIQASPSIGGGNTILIDLQFPRAWSDASVEIAVPEGYRGSATPVAFGTVMSHVTVEGVRADGSTVQRSGGTITVEDPEPYRQAAEGCAPGEADAVWRLEVVVDEETVETPIWVDRIVTGPSEAGFRLRLCPSLRSGSTAITRLTIATKAFWNPRQAGTYVWRARFTSKETWSSESIVRLPIALRLTSARTSERTLTVRGRASAAGTSLPAAPVRLWGRRADGSLRWIASARTALDGTFVVRRRSHATLVHATVSLPRRAVACTTSPSPCSASDAIPFPLATRPRPVMR